MTITPSESSHAQRKVITVTLNPSLDRTITTQFLAIGYHNRSTGTTRLDPAGRGVSVSRALYALGVETHAIVVLGHDANGRAYESVLCEEQFPMTVLRREGETRHNTIILDASQQNETVITEESSGISRHDRQAVATTLAEITAPGDTVVFAGGLPPQVRPDTYAVLTSLVQTKGAAVAINAGGGDALEKSIQARPRLIYLTQQQLERLNNIPVRVTEDVIACARQLQERGVRRVLVAMEETHSALLLTEDGGWLAQWPEGEGSRGGCAEALIAGYLGGRLRQESFEDSLALGAAVTAYTAMQVGHEFPTVRDAQEIASQVTIITLEPTAVLLA